MVTFEQGDIIIMNFNPQQGHKTKWKNEPAFVVSNTLLNEHSSLIMVCPITNTDKSHPFHVNLDDSTSVKRCDISGLGKDVKRKSKGCKIR